MSDIQRGFNADKFSKLLKLAIGNNRSITQFSEDSNVARPYISNFVNCRLDKPPSPEIIMKFAKVAVNDVKAEDLLYAAGYRLSDSDQIDQRGQWGKHGQSDQFFHILANIDQPALTNIRNNLLKMSQKKDTKIQRTPIEIPVLSFIHHPEQIICPGEENIFGYEYISASSIYDASKCFYYIANDRSMTGARIHKGDIALIVPDYPYYHNNIVLILKDGEPFLRRYKKLNSILLFHAENNEFDSFAINNTEFKNSTSITIIGTVKHIKIDTNI